MNDATATDSRIRSIVIVGGGTAGWMTAAALANRFKQSVTKITLVESVEIGIIGVGEATVPYIKEFLQDLNVNEVDFMRATKATYKLGIDFDGWYKPGEKFIHPFAGYGARIARIPFHHYWAKMRMQKKAQALDAYCLAVQMARHNKFALPKANNDLELSSFNYAFHFDAGLFAHYLSGIAQTLGVKRIQANVKQVNQCPDSGFIRSLGLDTGEIIEGEFFIDCSGFNGLLIEQTLKTGYENWNQWLRCDRAVAMPCTSELTPASATRSLAMEAGWQWRIPLQHRVGNGYVYCSDFISDDIAAEKLRENLEGGALADPKFIRFTTGMRKKAWNKNVFCVGLASGFMEPLESTSIYLIQSSLALLLNHFPNKQYNQTLIDTVNSNLRTRQEKLRDFLILHYHANQRHGQKFWDECRHMSIPETLAVRIDHFKKTCQPQVDELDFFGTNSWLAMFSGFNIQPDYYHPVVDDFDEQDVERELANINQKILNTVAQLPTHKEFIQKNITNMEVTPKI
ncbi:tryptophan halogenase family protein [Cellvibrio mixtus]|uniref:tryptophan halogenase family protein n=1 Tax=Cellvibrio mixtus TaxID=39650 RepID=UPI00058728E2|nr:tryptophan halogenase family protein [Cellvibrio mixtus]